jgi:hypothetical protein
VVHTVRTYADWYRQTRQMSFDDVADTFVNLIKCFDGWTTSRHTFETTSFIKVHHEMIAERLTEIMARTNRGFVNDEKSVKMAAKVSNPAWLGFVEIQLTEGDIARVDDLLNGIGKDYTDEMTALARLGKISVSVQNGSYCATLTVSRVEGTKGLTAWGHDFFDALFCLYIKATTYPDWYDGTAKSVGKRG